MLTLNAKFENRNVALDFLLQSCLPHVFTLTQNAELTPNLPTPTRQKEKACLLAKAAFDDAMAVMDSRMPWLGPAD